MKKVLPVLVVSLSFLLTLSSCQPSTTTQSMASSDMTLGDQTTTASIMTGTETTLTDATTSMTTGTTAITETTTVATTADTTTVAATTEEPEPTNAAVMYSSYALMHSFDPSNGWAEFDYFDMLRGEAAVQWLVDVEGYALADAQAEVANFADSEFIMKNTNPQLRTIDLGDHPLKLMYHPDGSMVDGPDPIVSDIDDFLAIFTIDPDLVLHSFFYHIDVVDGVVQSVEQVYWP